MNYNNTSDIKRVLEEYEKLPDPEFLSKDLYEQLVDIINKKNNKDKTNGEVMMTLKLMVIQMCEKMVNDTNEWATTKPDSKESFTDKIREEYK